VFEVFAPGDDQGVREAGVIRRFPERSERQGPAVPQPPDSVDQENVHIPPQGKVLVPVIEEERIDLEAPEAFRSRGKPGFPDEHRDAGEGRREEGGLIPYPVRFGVPPGASPPCPLPP
jgi:hypothetical protein